jgi:hypothetical protein
VVQVITTTTTIIIIIILERDGPGSGDVFTVIL